LSFDRLLGKFFKLFSFTNKNIFTNILILTSLSQRLNLKDYTFFHRRFFELNQKTIQPSTLFHTHFSIRLIRLPSQRSEEGSRIINSKKRINLKKR